MSSLSPAITGERLAKLPSSHWHREPLAWYHVKQFDRVIRKGDLIECLSNGQNVQDSLDWAIHHGGGECWAVCNGSEVMGVYGWTSHGAAWSYWKDLTREETKELMRVTPAYILEMLEHATDYGLRQLANYVWEGNREAILWLRASHCFDLDVDHRYKIGNKQFIAFRTKPLEELRGHV